MGADLYIDSIFHACQGKYKDLFEEAYNKRDADKSKQDEAEKYYRLMYSDCEGYFRDSYNCSSLFWVYGKSWWKDLKSKMIGLRMNRRLHKEFSNPIPMTAEQLTAHLKEHGGKIDDEDNIEVWMKHFEDKRQKFLKFLDKAYELHENIRCSV